MRISDWSSDVCSSDPAAIARSTCRWRRPPPITHCRPRWRRRYRTRAARKHRKRTTTQTTSTGGRSACQENRTRASQGVLDSQGRLLSIVWRSEEHTSELQSLMSSSYAVFCLQKKKIQHKTQKKI